jgi:hypothetical protein
MGKCRHFGGKPAKGHSLLRGLRGNAVLFYNQANRRYDAMSWELKQEIKENTEKLEQIRGYL